MEEYRKGAHTVYDIKYHIVWTTKYRYHILKGEVALRARDLIRQTCLAYEVRIIKGHVGKDHIHAPFVQLIKTENRGKSLCDDKLYFGTTPRPHHRAALGEAGTSVDIPALQLL